MLYYQHGGTQSCYHSPVLDLIHLIRGGQDWTWKIVWVNQDGGHGLVLGRQRNWNFSWARIGLTRPGRGWGTNQEGCDKTGLGERTEMRCTTEANPRIVHLRRLFSNSYVRNTTKCIVLNLFLLTLSAVINPKQLGHPKKQKLADRPKNIQWYTYLDNSTKPPHIASWVNLQSSVISLNKRHFMFSSWNWKALPLSFRSLHTEIAEE